MNAAAITAHAPTGWTNSLTTFQITGFDRRNFVNEITHAIPQDDHCRILGMSFEVVEGVRVMGSLTVNVADETYRATIGRQLRAVQGVVSINEIN